MAPHRAEAPSDQQDGLIRIEHAERGNGLVVSRTDAGAEQRTG
jgi:hypothetical protein